MEVNEDMDTASAGEKMRRIIETRMSKLKEVNWKARGDKVKGKTIQAKERIVAIWNSGNKGKCLVVASACILLWVFMCIFNEDVDCALTKEEAYEKVGEFVKDENERENQADAMIKLASTCGKDAGPIIWRWAFQRLFIMKLQGVVEDRMRANPNATSEELAAYIGEFLLGPCKNLDEAMECSPSSGNMTGKGRILVGKCKRQASLLRQSNEEMHAGILNNAPSQKDRAVKLQRESVELQDAIFAEIK